MQFRLSPVTVVLLILANVASAETVAGSAKALNQFRAGSGKSALVLSDTLQKTAEGHARDMRDKGFFSHTGSNGSTVGQRARGNGYGYCLIAENIAKGQRNLTEVMHSWETSAGHRKNMLLKDIKEFGLARREGNIWVMVLGRSGC
jgi:uncharacterized protein YkwD